jgi:magnesium transporter
LPRLIKKSSKTRGLAPGALVHIGEKKTDKVKITLIDFDEKSVEEKELKNIEECFPFINKNTTTWVNIDGLHEIDVIEKIGNKFEIHPLVLEDILNTDQRPKMEDFDKYIFFVIKMLYIDDITYDIHSEQVSLILGKNIVLSFQESLGDVFDPVRGRIRSGKTRIRRRGTDYLCYALLDAIVDNYFSILEKIGEKVENIEHSVVSNPSPDLLKEIYNLKRDLIYLRKSVWPLREVINNLQREESKLIKETTHIFLRDLYDHTIQVIDTVETFRDMISGMLDIYMSSVSNKMNEVMKVLTIFAAIFIPLTFIAGVYGMNFQHMPELAIPWAYPAVWAVIIIVSVSLLLYFKHKKWL